jgi:hypothetical protein
LKAQKFSGFSMHECNAHICSLSISYLKSWDVTASPPLNKLRPEVRTLLHFGMNSKVVIIYLATPSPTNLDIYGIHCLEFLLNLPLSNSEQSLEFYPTSSLFGTSLGLSMF